jgi:hypothetical protein
MSFKSILAAFAIVIALVVPLSAASTVTLTGGCPLYVINSSRSYITFNLTNSGNGTASDLLISANFAGISARNATQVIPNVEPQSSYSKQFYLNKLVGQGSYAVNINATYVQSGSNYATVFPCIIYIGSLAGGPLEESVSISGNKMLVNITNTAPQSIEAQIDAVVPPSFSVKNATKAVTIGADGHSSVYFNIVSPTYTQASFPVIGELSYEYNGTHYAQMGSAALIFGSGGVAKSSGGIGLIGWILIVVVIIILVLIVVSVLVRRGKGRKENQHQVHNHENAAEEGK